MKVKIQSVADAGDLEKERLILKATSSTNIGEYVLLQTGYYDDSVLTEVYNTMWFPDKEISDGDLVVIYTKSGTDKTKEKEGQLTAHFYYWNLDVAHWDTDNKIPVLCYAPSWIYKKPSEL